MNLKQEFNQKQQQQNRQKQNLEQSFRRTNALQPLEQQDHQQSCCNNGDERLAGYVKAGAKKPSGLTAEKLKTFPELADLSDQDAGEIAETLIYLSQLAYEMFQLKQKETKQLAEAKYASKKQQPGCNKTVAVGAQAKQQQKIGSNALKQPKVNRVTRKSIIK